MSNQCLLVGHESGVVVDVHQTHLQRDLNGQVQDNFSLYVERRVIDELSPQESYCHLLGRRILQGFGSIVASLGKVSFVAISMELAGDNKVLGGFLVYGNLVSFATLICWSALNIIGDYMSPVGEEVNALQSAKQSRCKSCAILIASVVIGVIAQMPLAYLAYR